MILFFFSSSIFFGCSQNPEQPENTANKSDTIYVYDTIFVVDTVLLLDTLVEIDTLIFYDTLYINDTVLVRLHGVFYIKSGSVISPFLRDAEPIEFLILSTYSADSVDASILVGGDSVPLECIRRTSGVVFRGYWFPDDFSPHEYEINVTLLKHNGDTLASIIDTVKVAMIGVSQVTFINSIPYIYYKSKPGRRDYIVISDTITHWRIGGGNSIVDESGNPLPMPSFWTSVDYPPFKYIGRENYNIPAVYKIGDSVYIEAVVISNESIYVTTGVDTMPVTPPVDTVQLKIPIVLPERIGIYDYNIKFNFFDAKKVKISGSFVTNHVFYNIFSEPVLLDSRAYGGSPPYPWLAVLAYDLQWCNGAMNMREALADLRQALYYDMGLYYSSRNYIHYDGPYTNWERVYLHLGEFLDLENGNHLYCHDMALIFSAFAGNMGIALPELYLGIGFRTYPIRGVGHSGWTTYSWTAHGINSPDSGITVYDAVLNLDGDGDPSSSPHIDWDVIALPLDVYLRTLSPAPPVVRGVYYPYIL